MSRFPYKGLTVLVRFRLSRSERLIGARFYLHDGIVADGGGVYGGFGE
jgi:hypothetical protein